LELDPLVVVPVEPAVLDANVCVASRLVTFTVSELEWLSQGTRFATGLN